MKVRDLRAVLLWRAIDAELAASDGPPAGAGRAALPGATDDRVGDRAGDQAGDRAGDQAGDQAGDWAGAEARRRLGEPASPEAWLAERARLLLQRLGEQQPAWRPVLDAAALASGRGWAAGLLVAAAALGALGGPLGSSQHLHLLAPPLLGLMLWNLVVYGGLALQALRPARPGAGAQVPDGAWGRSVTGLIGLMTRGRARLARDGSALDTSRAAAWARFQRDWLALSAPWQACRGMAWMHAAAAALALGALASWYARGLVLDYRAGWDSTFLGVEQVRALLGVVLGPAAALTGQPLPDAAALAALRGANGGAESAARWIHLWSLTVLGVVVLPRTALAAWQGWRARQLSRHLALPDDDGLRRLLRAARGQRLAVGVLPYSYQIDAARQAALLRLLDSWWGPGLEARVQPSLALGAEDDLAGQLPAGLAADPAARLVVLFALTATPERESHGAFLRALAAH